MYKEPSKSQVYAIVQYIEQYLLEFYFIFMNYQNIEQHIYVGKKIAECWCMYHFRLLSIKHNANTLINPI
jgi:hypothetical protein